MTDANQYTIPKEPGLGRSLLFAALVHAALLVFLWIGVQWQSDHPATIEAEVWDPQPREAAPLPEPVKAPEPVPEPKPIIKEPPKPKVEEPPPVAKPDIALEQEKKRKALEEKKRREEEERLAKEKKRLEEEKLAKLKQEEAKREKEKAEKAKKEAAEKIRLQEEAEAKLLAKMREEDMKRITGTGTGGSGDAPKAQGGRASADWASKAGAKIKSHITFVVPEGLQGNPPVEYEVRLLPDGSVAGMRKLRSSGVPGFDEAVARAIERAQPFPRDSNGGMPSSFTGTHKPKD